MIHPEIDTFLKSGKKVAKLATVSSKGWPQVTPVWYLYENGHIYITTVPTRVKFRNIEKNPRVAMYFDGPDYGVQIQGKVVRSIREGLREWNRRIAARYNPPDQVEEAVNALMKSPRVILEIVPVRISKH